MSKELNTAESILEKIHLSGGDEGLKNFVESKGADIPPIKLSPQEMQYLKGGGFWTDIKSALSTNDLNTSAYYVNKAFRELL